MLATLASAAEQRTAFVLGLGIAGAFFFCWACAAAGAVLTLLPVPVKPAVVTIYQDKRTGKRVRRVGAEGGKEEFVLVKGQDNAPYYALLSNLIPCDADGTPDFSTTAAGAPEEEADEAIPDPIIDIAETRLNVNTATAEEIAKRVPGVGYRVAKTIKSNQLSQPGEIYRTLDQLRSASSRVAWDKVFASNTLYVG